KTYSPKCAKNPQAGHYKAHCCGLRCCYRVTFHRATLSPIETEPSPCSHRLGIGYIIEIEREEEQSEKCHLADRFFGTRRDYCSPRQDDVYTIVTAITYR